MVRAHALSMDISSTRKKEGALPSFVAIPDSRAPRPLRQLAHAELSALQAEWGIPALRLLWVVPCADDDPRLHTAWKRNPRARTDRRPFWTLAGDDLAYVLEGRRLWLRADMQQADVKKALTVAVASLLTNDLRAACRKAGAWLNRRQG